MRKRAIGTLTKAHDGSFKEQLKTLSTKTDITIAPNDDPDQLSDDFRHLRPRHIRRPLTPE